MAALERRRSSKRGIWEQKIKNGDLASGRRRGWTVNERLGTRQRRENGFTGEQWHRNSRCGRQHENHSRGNRRVGGMAARRVAIHRGLPLMVAAVGALRVPSAARVTQTSLRDVSV